jgi:pre-mRNA-splicing factor ISY1
MGTRMKGMKLSSRKRRKLRGGVSAAVVSQKSHSLMILDWERAVAETAEILGLPDGTSIPYPLDPTPSTQSAPEAEGEAISQPTPAKKTKGGKSKRKAPEPVPETDVEPETETKKAKTDDPPTTITDTMSLDHAANAALTAATGFLKVLEPDSLRMPVMPSQEEMGKILLEVRKKALREEYGV